MFTKCLFIISVPLDPPPPNQQSDGFPLDFLFKGPQDGIANTQPKLRTNPPQIANKQNYEQTGASDLSSKEISNDRESPNPNGGGETYHRRAGPKMFVGRSLTCVPAGHLRQFACLRAENCEKVSEKSSRAFRPGVSKKSRKGRKLPEKSPKSVILGSFQPFRDFFETPGRKGREDFLETFWRLSARRDTTFDGLFPPS